MKAFEFIAPSSVGDAVRMLHPGPDTDLDIDERPLPMAGGQDLLTAMKDYILRPGRIVNLKSIRGLDRIEGDGKNGLKLGALVTLAELEEHDVVRKSFPGIAEAAHSVATQQIRNLATIGGNLCQRPRCWYYRLESVVCLKKGGSECYAASGENKYHAILGGGPSYIVHPSDLAPMLVALGASASVAGPGGNRMVNLDQFFTLPRDGSIRRENVLKTDEIITEIRVPPSQLAASSTYLKFKERESLDFAMSAVAAALEMNEDQTVRQARIVLGGVAPIPWRARKAEAFITGKKLGIAELTEASRLAVDGAKPLAKNAYKIPLTQTLVRRALLKAVKA